MLALVNVHKEESGKVQLCTEESSDFFISSDKQRGPLLGLQYEMRLATLKMRKKVLSALGSNVTFLLKPKFVLASHFSGIVSVYVLSSPSAVVLELLNTQGKRKILFLVL